MRPSDVPIPSSPTAPFPLTTPFCDVVAGFGRGSAQLGIPTANVPAEQLPEDFDSLALGVYFGFARLQPTSNDEDDDHHHHPHQARPDGSHVHFNNGSRLATEDLQTLPVVLSVGMNPFYHNQTKTVELHLVHTFAHDFYGAQVKFRVLGYIRPELDYTSRDALIADIRTDIALAQRALALPGYAQQSDF
ncbi:LAME_0D08372g1_1 [Lachancea meyersii CBS 8951]|uniref:Riboflavin kinase n=1 Tax=Lachancea meyersii CBS 8951 TaxID=1266667 RepID=A0A1G4JAA2_9SACH|nr:LAME_0D08372g1_1 [Lachancea meyersii CBS 8951]